MNRTLLAVIPAMVVVAVSLIPSSAQDSGMVKERYPDVQGKTLEYQDGETVCEGFVAWDSNLLGTRPAVLIVHDWMGRGSFDESRARELASMGYVAFSADVYGKGVRPANRDEARKSAGEWYGNPEALRTRLAAALDALKSHSLVDKSKIAVIGYCFGGMCALELARSGADIAGAVSFHGSLGTSKPSKAGDIKASILVLHGADDPNFGPDTRNAFWAEMAEAKVDWQLVAYGNAVHSFSNPAAGNDPSRGSAYDEKADRRSWKAMKDFFTEIFRG